MPATQHSNTGIAIVDAAPIRPRRPFRRWIAVAFGLLFTAVGVLLFLPALTILTVTAVFWAADGNAAFPELNVVLVILATTVAGVALWTAGVKLLRGKPRTVLFLRKFGFDNAKEFVSYAAAEALGQRWRLVTLDDLATKPVTTKTWKRWGVRVAILVAIMLGVFMTYQALQLLINPDTSAAGDAFDNAVENSDNPIEGIVSGIVVSIVTALVVAIFTAMAVIFLSAIVGLAGALGFASMLTTRSLARVERDRWTAAATPQQLAAFLKRVEAAGSKLFAPRVSVVRTTDELWKQAVAGLATISHVVLIDISDPSESLLWELQMLSRRPDVELVLIGAADRLHSLKHSGGHDPDDRAVLEILGDRHVLAYSENRKAFAGSLRAMFDATIHTDRRP